MLPLWRTVPVVLGRPPRSRERSALRGAGGFVVPGRNGENDLYLGSPAGRERRLGRLAARVRAQAPAVVVVADPGLWRLTGDLDFGPVKRVLVLEAFQAEDAEALAAAKAADEVWVRDGADAAALAKALGTKAAKRLLRMPASVEGGAPVAYEAGAMVMAPLDGGADDEAGVALARAVAERLAAEGVPVTLSFIPADADPGAVEHLAEEAAIILAPFDAPHYRPSLLFALAMGRPLVASPGAMDGLALKAGEQALVGKDAGELAEHIVALLADPERAAAMGAAAAAGVRAKHDIDTTRALLRAAKGDAAGDPQEMAGANVAPTIRQLEVFFNPTSRLFTATAFLRCAAPNSAITGCFQVEGVENLANAWVQTTAQPDGWNFISADAVLPADVSIPQLSVVIEAFGLPVMTLRFPEDVDRERAGFISLELDDFSLKVDAWSSDPELKLQAGTRMLSPEVIPAIGPEGAAAGEARTWKGEGDAPDITAQAVRLQGVSAWPLTREAVKAITSEGRGQNFGRLDEWFGAERPTSLRLQRMKDIHKGQVAWLIGNGPSVRVKDLDRLSGQVTFGLTASTSRTRPRPFGLPTLSPPTAR